MALARLPARRLGTPASAHATGETVAKLMDHGYKVFLTDAELTLEVARNIAELCNHAGTLQLSLDGLEGNWSTGMGQYGRTLFTRRGMTRSCQGCVGRSTTPATRATSTGTSPRA